MIDATCPDCGSEHFDRYSDNADDRYVECDKCGFFKWVSVE